MSNTCKGSKTVGTHNIETANKVLKQKGFDFLEVLEVDHAKHILVLLDCIYGEYKVSLDALCPKTQVSLHKMRVHANKMELVKKKVVGTVIKGALILDVFYAPDRGYKGKSFYLVYKCTCGKMLECPQASIKHKKTMLCMGCAGTKHGERRKIEGKLKKSPTYSYWNTHHKEFPERYHDFETFRKEVGTKPSSRSIIKIVEDRLCWVNSQVLSIDDIELNIIATAIRQAFKHSSIYLDTVSKARVETPLGTRYICALCGKLFKLKEMEVDHVVPITPVDGSPLEKSTLIERIWTDNVQLIDHECHVKKSTEENRTRKQAKKHLQELKDEQSGKVKKPPAKHNRRKRPKAKRCASKSARKPR